LGLGTLLLVAVWLLGSLLVVYRLTHRPHALFAEPAPTVSWATIEEHRLQTSDGESIGAWLVRGKPDEPVVLVLHGFRGSRGASLPAAKFYAEQGCSVLMITMRAHGDSTGEINDVGYSGRHDVVAAVAFLEKDLPSRPILVDGTSMGAAAAIFAAAELGTHVRGYILESPYRDLHRAVRNRLSMYLPYPLDRVAYTGTTLMAPLVLPDVDRIAPIDHVADIPESVPVLFLTGTKDPRAQLSEVQELCDRTGGHAHLALFEGAGHENLVAANPRRYAEVVAPFLREIGGP
jgi:alpha-beta hydrolase superfamily lysophospholipase